ncbi:MAG: hypothetical protein ACTSYB_12195 [Candidatus Helarchaeota archaeon]
MDEKKTESNPRNQYSQRRRNNRKNRGKSRRPRNIRYGTKFCGECRACEFWVTAKFGRYRCENSYLPFEILEFRRDAKTNQIKEIVINLLV